MKKCNRCKLNMPLEFFAKNKAKSDGLQVMCRPCKKEVDAKHYKGNKEAQLARNRAAQKKRWEYVAAKKTGPCMDCGKAYIPFAMDFDHVRGVKILDISNMCANTVPFAVLDEELAKCDLVCATCHRIRTYNRRLGL